MKSYRYIFFNIFFTLFCFLAFGACSLRYDSFSHDESGEPELIFTDAAFSRYEDNKKTLTLEAGRLEQYKGGSNVYAKDLSFTLIKDGEEKTKGKCGLLAADTDAKKYMLSNSIEVEQIDDDLVMNAKSLKWDGNSEQLVAARNDVVTIKKGNTLIQGSGFSASGISKKFSFTGVITGETRTKKDKHKNGEAKEGEEAEENEEAEEAKVIDEGVPVE